MKRDMDLIRTILLAVESHPHGYAPHPLEVNGYSDEQITYHCYLLKQAGLVDGLDRNVDQAPSPGAIILNLTWQGHEFISSARSPAIWSQTKDAMRKVGDGSFQVWQSVLTEILKNSLGLG